MNDSLIVSVRQVEESMAGGSSPVFSFSTHDEAYAWISEVLDRFGYHKTGPERLSKKEKMSIRKYLAAYTAY